MTESLAGTYVNELFPEASSVEHITTGYQNDIYIVDNTFVVRLPKTKAGRQLLLGEVTLLQELEGRIELEIPRVHSYEPDGSRAVFGYLKGDVLSNDEIINLSSNKLSDLAVALARLIEQMNQALSTDFFKQHSLGVTSSKSQVLAEYNKLRAAAVRQGHPALGLYDRARVRYDELAQTTVDSPAMVVHGDLHSGNLLFQDDSLSGVIDFGDCRVGTIYDEIRQLYRLGEGVVGQLINQLDGRYGDVSIELLHANSVLHEASVLLRSALPDEYPNEEARIDVAKQLLEQWL